MKTDGMICGILAALMLAAGGQAFEPLFDARIDYGVGEDPASVIAADFDGDGDNDLAVANSGSIDVSILKNLSVQLSAGGNSTTPFHFQLLHNYPNPFNAQTLISYELQLESDVTIDIYDLLGRKVVTLSDGIQPAGNHQMTGNAGGHPSGIYFYKIKAGNFAATAKMVLLK